MESLHIKEDAWLPVRKFKLNKSRQNEKFIDSQNCGAL
jgi:hypothetical protein